MADADAVSEQFDDGRWDASQEKLLRSWAEMSDGYRWLHNESYKRFRKSMLRFTVPVIIMTTLTGTANFAQDSFPAHMRDYVPMGIGLVNLIAAMMTTVSQFLKINELVEGHRVAAVAFGKLNRDIAVELNMPRSSRKAGGSTFLRQCQTEYNRIIEQSPMIPRKVTNMFYMQFMTKTPTDDMSIGQIIDKYSKKAARKVIRVIFCASGGEYPDDDESPCDLESGESSPTRRPGRDRSHTIASVPFSPYKIHKTTTGRNCKKSPYALFKHIAKPGIMNISAVDMYDTEENARLTDALDSVVSRRVDDVRFTDAQMRQIEMRTAPVARATVDAENAQRLKEDADRVAHDIELSEQARVDEKNAHASAVKDLAGALDELKGLQVDAAAIENADHFEYEPSADERSVSGEVMSPDEMLEWANTSDET